jgi:hypothetical protein
MNQENRNPGEWLASAETGLTGFFGFVGRKFNHR